MEDLVWSVRVLFLPPYSNGCYKTHPLYSESLLLLDTFTPKNRDVQIYGLVDEKGKKEMFFRVLGSEMKA